MVNAEMICMELAEIAHKAEKIKHQASSLDEAYAGEGLVFLRADLDALQREAEMAIRMLRS